MLFACSFLTPHTAPLKKRHRAILRTSLLNETQRRWTDSDRDSEGQRTATAYRTRQHRRQAIAPQAAEQATSMMACSALLAGRIQVVVSVTHNCAQGISQW